VKYTLPVILIEYFTKVLETLLQTNSDRSIKCMLMFLQIRIVFDYFMPPSIEESGHMIFPFKTINLGHIF
jgi:hypothetical protein